MTMLRGCAGIGAGDPRGLAVGLVAAVVLAATVPARLVAWACTSGEEEVGSDERICESIGEFGTWGWWAAVLWPAAVFAGAQVVPVLDGIPPAWRFR